MELSEKDENLIEAATSNSLKMKQPNCPRCHYEPLEFACNIVRTAGGHLVSVIWCGHCGNTLNVQIVGMDAPQIHRPGPTIVRPS